jgi:hypothetical protein
MSIRMNDLGHAVVCQYGGIELGTCGGPVNMVELNWGHAVACPYGNSGGC